MILKLVCNTNKQSIYLHPRCIRHIVIHVLYMVVLPGTNSNALRFTTQGKPTKEQSSHTIKATQKHGQVDVLYR